MRFLTDIINQTKKHRLFLLLCVLIGFLVFTPLAELAGFGSKMLTIAFFIVIIAAMNSAREQISWSLVAVAVGVPTAILWSLRLIFEDRFFLISADIFTMILMVFTTVLVLRRVLIYEENDFDTLSGAAAVYLLLGLSWAASYEFIETLDPGAFGDISGDPIERWNELVYFSMTTLTTLGYGDIQPHNAFARLWSTMEAATGVLYLAILVARLIAIYRHPEE